jgi:adenosine kinase
MAMLGLRPMLAAAVGADFADYREWLESHGVDTRHVHVSADLHTARFLCTTDTDNNQIATFYAGAMNEARHIDVGAVLDSHADTGIVVICPDDPEAMVRHTRTCRAHGVAFAADPSQQIARMPGSDLRELVLGARYLFTNEYERSLLTRKAGWTEAEILARVGIWVTTTGPKGATVESAGQPAVTVPAVIERRMVDPTGVGDAFRAGFFAGVTWGLSAQRAAQIGCAMAVLVLETAGTQEYGLDPGDFGARLAEAYGPDAAAEITACLAPGPRAPAAHARTGTERT